MIAVGLFGLLQFKKDHLGAFVNTLQLIQSILNKLKTRLLLTPGKKQKVMREKKHMVIYQFVQM